MLDANVCTGVINQFEPAKITLLRTPRVFIFRVSCEPTAYFLSQATGTMRINSVSIRPRSVNFRCGITGSARKDS